MPITLEINVAPCQQQQLAAIVMSNFDQMSWEMEVCSG